MKADRPPRSLSALTAYFGITFLVSWSCWLPAAWSTAGMDTGVIRTLVYAGIAGPLVGAVAMLYLTGNQEQRAEFWERVYDLDRLRLRWLAAILLAYPVLTVLAVGAGWTLNGSGADPSVLMRLLPHPRSFATYVVLIFLLGPLPEELGWRGYALDRLQARWTPLTSSLVLGVIWAAWHLPLFFVTGTYQHGLGFGTFEFWLFDVSVIASSVLFTFMYNCNGRSILSAVLLHGVINFTSAVVALPLMAEAARTFLLIALACGIAVFWEKENSRLTSGESPVWSAHATKLQRPK